MTVALTHAHRVLDWQENLMSEEMPPEWMWPLDDALESWFKEVERKRKDRFGGSGDDDDDDGTPMMHNEYAKDR